MSFTEDDLKAYLRKVYGYLTGAMTSGMIYLGDRMGLYRAMQGAGPMTAADLADRTGLHERWVLEWLRQQAAAEIVAYDGGERFELTDLGAFVLADEEGSPAFSAGAFSGLPQQFAVLEDLPDSFRTGLGLSFDAQGRAGNHAVARMFAPWYRHMLVPVVLRGLDGVVEKLRRGAKVADVGCGAGIALITMAKAFPESRFQGYDISKHALALAQENLAGSGLDNVTFHDAGGEALPTDGSFDLVTTFDCVHDMTHPREVIQAIREALADDGTYLIADIKAKPTLAENLEDNPMVALEYGMSILSCMSSALSEPDGAGLGTLGFTTERARAYTRQAGFTRFTEHDFGHPVNVYYEIRP